VNTVVSGRITRLADFGAFVQLEEGLEGLIPISEMAYERRISHPREVVSEGQVLQLRVLNVDPDRKRVSLSLKRMGEDPWMGASVRWQPGSLVAARVKRLSNFGAFLELTPGVEGLLHISELSHGRVNSVGDVVQEGQEVEVKILSVDEDQRRIALSLKQCTAMPEVEAVRETAAPVPEQAGKSRRKRPLRGGLDR
jgi:ribosomal protein S1